MKKLSYVFLLSLLFLLLAGCSKEDVQLEPLKTNDDVLLEKAKPDRFVPFKATFEVYVDEVLQTPPPPPKVQVVLGTGNVTHLGKTDLYMLQNWYPKLPPTIPPEGIGNGELIFTAANGDELLASYTDAESIHFSPTYVTVTFTGIFKDGGTGRFAHAKGTFNWVGEFNPSTNIGITIVTGEIMYNK